MFFLIVKREKQKPKFNKLEWRLYLIFLINKTFFLQV